MVFVFVLGAIVVGVYLTNSKDKAMALLEEHNDSIPLNSVSIESIAEPKKVVSIPKPLTVATSKDLTPKVELVQPDARDKTTTTQDDPLAQDINITRTQVANDVIEKITEQTGIPQQEIEEAMTRKPY